MSPSFIAALLMLTVSTLAQAVESAPPSAAVVVEPRQLGEQLMRFAAADDMAGLFKHMGTISPMEKSQLDGFRDNLVAQRKAIGPKLGVPAGFAFVSECRRGDVLNRVIFVEKRTRSPMRWAFIFYKARDKWQLIHFDWDDKAPEYFAPCT